MLFIRTTVTRALALACAALALSPQQAAAQTQALASLSPMPRMQFFGTDGKPLAGGCIQTFQAGSSTPIPTYTNASATVPNPNPLTLDSLGMADIWLSSLQAYKITVRAKTVGCAGGGGAILYTTDQVLDQGSNLAHTLASGSLAIGLVGSPITGAGGGVGVGNALLSATIGGLYVSVNGGAPTLLTSGGGGGGGGGGGTPGAPVNSIQFNSAGAFAGSSSFIWNNPTATATITGATTAGFQAPTYASSNTGTNPAFTANNGAAQILGNGDATFQNAGFQSTAITLKASPLTGLAGGTGVGNAMLSATTAGLYLSLNGAPPALLTGGGGTGSPGGPTTSVQYNNAGTFAGSANLTWDNAGATLTVVKAGVNSGILSPIFSGNVSAGGSTFKNSDGSFTIDSTGNGLFQALSVTATFNSLATGTASAIQQVNGTFKVTGAGDAGFQSVGIGLRATPLTGLAGGTGVGNATLSATTAGLYLSLNGNPPVLMSGTGGGTGTPGGPQNSVQYNNAGTFAGVQNMTFASSTGILTIFGATTSGVQAPVFSSSNTGAVPAFVANNGAAQINGNGDATFQNVTVNATFNSVATGTTKVIQQVNGTFAITGAGDAGFQSVGIGLRATPLTGLSGGTGAGSATLSATTAGLYLSLNGGAPALLATGGAPGGPVNAVQYNSGGTFAGSPNLTYDQNVAIMTITGAGTSGFQAPVFSSSNTGGSDAIVVNNGAAHIVGDGRAFFQSIALTNGITVGNGFYGLGANGALTVSSCSGCGAGVTSWNGRNGAVTLQKQDVTNVTQALGTGDTPTFAGVAATGAFSSARTGANAAFTQQGGTFQINGDGKAFFQSVCVNGNPATEACTNVFAADGTLTAGGITALTAGANITKTGLNYGISEHDTGGGCNIGTAYAGGIGCSSDARLKKAVRNLPDSLALILKLRPVAFQWSKNNESGIGFIAQEVQTLLPGLVHRADDGYLLLDQGGMTPLLVQAVQQLAARVAVLEGGKR